MLLLIRTWLVLNSSHISDRFGGVFVELRGWVKFHFSFNFLLFLLSCYIIASRCGPLLSRVGDLAIETFEVERLIVEEYDVETLRLFREAYTKFRVVTRAPYPVLLFGRVSQDNTLQSSTNNISIMGGKSSKNNEKSEKNSTSIKTSSEQPTTDKEGVTKKEAALLGDQPTHGDEISQVKKDASQVNVVTQEEEQEEESEGVEEVCDKKEEEVKVGEGEGEKVGEGKGEEVEERGGEGVREDATSPGPEPLPLKRLTDLRNDSEFSLQIGSTESLLELTAKDRLNPAEYKKPIKFKTVKPTIRTGDLALLYRRDQVIPHVAVFINHIESDPLFPLLLVKAKTKPLSLETFDGCKPRFIHPITATTRIFYGDYDRVAVRYVNGQSDNGTDVYIDAQTAMDAIDKVEAIPFSEKERAAIASAKDDRERSVYMSTFMAAYYYKELGIFTGTPDEVTPENFLSQLPLSDPLYIKLPHVKLGPMVHGDPPFLKQLVDGVFPAQTMEPIPYEKAIEGLDTGDLILFSGATSAGALIKFFDHSQFSHVALVLKAQYTSQLLIWEASTNHAKLVDVQVGAVRTGVEVLPLRNKVFSGWYDRVAIRRLQNMTTEKRREIYDIMLKLRKEWMGRAYEKDMLQLALSAINPSASFLSLFQNTQDDLSSIFCSELVAAAYQRMKIIHNDRPSNTYTPDDFSSARDSSILCEGVELSEEIYIELKWPKNTLTTQHSIY